MSHEIGKVLEVTTYITSDNTVFEDKTKAEAYEKALSTALTENKIKSIKREYLKRLASGNTRFNGYYRLIQGNFYGTNSVSDAFRSMMLETPEITLKMLITLDEIVEKEIKGDFPKQLAEGVFVQEKI